MIMTMITMIVMMTMINRMTLMTMMMVIYTDGHDDDDLTFVSFPPWSHHDQVSLASRFDSYGNDPSGHVGRQWRADVEEKIEKWQELQTAKTKKALPKPDDMPARKRGGKR